MGTFDLIYPRKKGRAYVTHGISTVFIVEVVPGIVRADKRHSAGIKWGNIDYWLENTKDEYLRRILTLYAGR